MPAVVMGGTTPVPEEPLMPMATKPTATTTTATTASSTANEDESTLFPDLLSAEEAQWLFTEEELHLTPSVRAGLTVKEERQNRAKGVNFILQVGILLKLPQITLATAAVFLHRFFMRHTMKQDARKTKSRQQDAFHYYSVAAASVWLAAKVEENCRKMKEVVVACVRVAQKDSNKVVDEQDKEYWRWRDTIIMLEDRLLEGLCFDLSLESPYKVLYDIICRFDAQNNKVFRNAAWAFVNDSCFAPLCVLFPSRTIAAASVYAAARSCRLDFLDEHGQPWWDIIHVPLRDIRRACNYMADVYEDAPLREGARQDLYQRTPVNGDERTAKTRAHGGDDHQQQTTFTREGSVASNAASDVSRKRSRNNEDDSNNKNGNGGNDKNGGGGGTVRDTGQQPVSMNDVPWGGESPREREAKRVKQEAALNGFSELQPREPGEDAPVDKKRVDDDEGSDNVVVDDGAKTPPTKHKHGDRHFNGGGNGAGVPKAKKEDPAKRKGKDPKGPEAEVAKAGDKLGAVSPDLGGSEEGELDE